MLNFSKRLFNLLNKQTEIKLMVNSNNKLQEIRGKISNDF